MSHISALLVEHRNALLAYAKGHAPAGVDAEDLVGQVTERALARADQVGDEPRAWLYSILRSRIADAHRRQGRVDRRNSTLTAATPPAMLDAAARPDRIVEDSPACSCYAEFIADRSDPSVDALRRVAVHEQSAAEAAAELGISSGAFHVRLHRGRNKVKQVLRDRCGVSTLREARDCECSSGCGGGLATASRSPAQAHVP